MQNSSGSGIYCREELLSLGARASRPHKTWQGRGDWLHRVGRFTRRLALEQRLDKYAGGTPALPGGNPWLARCRSLSRALFCRSILPPSHARLRILQKAHRCIHTNVKGRAETEATPTSPLVLPLRESRSFRLWGVAKDHREAIRWFRKAAAQGHARAKKKLAELGVTTRNGKNRTLSDSRRLGKRRVGVHPSLTSGTVRWGVSIGLQSGLMDTSRPGLKSSS